MDKIFKEHLVVFRSEDSRYRCSCMRGWAQDDAASAFEHMKDEIRKGLLELALSEDTRKAWVGMSKKSRSGRLILMRLNAKLWGVSIG